MGRMLMLPSRQGTFCQSIGRIKEIRLLLLSFLTLMQFIVQAKQFISTAKQIKTATDPIDSGLFDIETVYNYESEHHFIHSYGNQLSDVLFVLGVYRYSDTNLTDLLGMTTITDEIKVSVSVFKANPSELKCSFCSVKTFCPTNQCECYQETYSDCRVVRKSIVAKTDVGTKINDSLTLKKGTISFVHIEPDTNATKEWYLAQVLMSFDDVNSNKSLKINPQKIFFLTFTQNKTDSSYMVPSIYNYDSIDSPSFSTKITSEPISTNSISPLTGADLPSSTQSTVDPNGVYIYEKVVLNKNEILVMAIYYLNDTETSSAITPDNQPNELNVEMEMTFGASLTNLAEGAVNLALVIGMIALGFFLLLVIVCVLHFIVSRRFSVFSIFANSESNRTSIYTGRPRSRKIANTVQQVSTLPQISFDFMKELIFKPLKYIYSPLLQQKLNNQTTKPTSLKLTPREQICSICLEDFTPCSIIKYTYCGHVLDSNCIQSWFNKEESCPMCRQKLEPQDVDEYEEKIMAEVWENQYYQGVVDKEVEVLKRFYKQWENRQKGIHKRGQLNETKYTEESLVENVTHKYIETTIHNISTMQQLQKTTDPIAITKNQTHRQPQKQSSQEVSLQSLPQLIQVFQNNKSISMKKFIKIYRFYRCVYLYHQINKKFDRDSNLFQGEVEKKEGSGVSEEKDMMRQEGRGNQMMHEMDDNQVDHNALYVTTRKQIIREEERQQQQQPEQHRELQRSPIQTRYRYQTQQDLQTDFSTSQKLKSTQSFKRIKNNKQGRAAFHLDFQFNQMQLQHQPSPNHNHQQSLQNSIITPVIILQPQPQPVLIREATDSSQQSRSLQIIQDKRTKVMSMRQEMNELEREFAEGNEPVVEKRSDSMNEEMRFRQHESVVFFQEDIEDARYAEVLSPVVLSPGKIQTRRQQQTNRQQITSSVQRSRRTMQFSFRGKKSSLSDNKKVQTPSNS